MRHEDSEHFREPVSLDLYPDYLQVTIPNVPGKLSQLSAGNYHDYLWVTIS